jgi:hypothetical protein
MEKDLNLMSAKSQIEGLQMLVKRYERKAKNALSETASSRYWGLASHYSGRIGELRRYVAEKELAIVGKEVPVC